MPELFDRFVTDALFHFAKDNPAQFAIPETVVEAFEIRQFRHHRLLDSTLAA
jgi:hypothetical protein